MDFEHMRAVEQAASQESEIIRLHADLARAEALLAEAGVPFARTPDRARPWLRPAPAPETSLGIRAIVAGEVSPRPFRAPQRDESAARVAGHAPNRVGVVA